MSSEDTHVGARELLTSRFNVPELLNTICHDVRAALAVTTGSANELASPDYGELSELQLQLIGMIQRGNTRLARLAANLMQVAELWEGTAQLKPTRFDLALLARQVTEEVRRGEPHSRVAVELDTPQLDVVLDLERTRHLLANVLGMAITVARARVHVQLREDENMARLRIEDDGPERVVQGAAAATAGATKKVSSAALVYTVGESIARLLGGRLHVEPPARDGKSGVVTEILLPRGPA